jgi:hypothetical protein
MTSFTKFVTDCHITMAKTVTGTETFTPLRRLAYHSTTTCAAQASIYGKCILASYTDLKKDACREEFAKFGRCLRNAVGGYYDSCFDSDS